MITSLLSHLHSLFFIAIGIIGLGCVISFHELGHFLVAKLFGIRVQTFSIGFGPTLISKKLGNTHFAISAVPLGGYNDFSNPEGKDDDELSLTSRPYYQKLFVILGGIIFNILLSYLIFTFLFVVGMPSTPMMPQQALPIVSKVEPESPAEKAGLKAGDHIIAVNGETIHDNTKRLLEIIEAASEQEITLTLERENAQETVSLHPAAVKVLGKTVGKIGAQFTLTALAPQSLVMAIKEGIALTHKHLHDTYCAFAYILSSCDTSRLAGPVSIFAATSKGAAQGFKIFLIFLAIISVNLAILNLIPLPILDGGQVLFYTIEAIIGRSIPDRIREYIFIGTWIGFMVLTVYLIGQDLMRMAGHYIKPILAFVGIGK